MSEDNQSPDTPQLDAAAVRLDEAGAEMYGREEWDQHINEGLDGITGESAEWLHAFREHQDPREAARAVHALCERREAIDALAKSDPAQAFQHLREVMADVAELSNQDKMTMQAWLELRQQQIADKAKPQQTRRTYISASSPRSDSLSAEAWVRNREAEIAKKAGR